MNHKLHAFAIGANIVSVSLNLVFWRPGSSGAGVTLGALTIMLLLLARTLGEAHLERQRALIRKAEAETAICEEMLARVRSGDASVTMTAAAPLRTM